jgi:hypothetical protein
LFWLYRWKNGRFSSHAGLSRVNILGVSEHRSQTGGANPVLEMLEEIHQKWWDADKYMPKIKTIPLD